MANVCILKPIDENNLGVFLKSLVNGMTLLIGVDGMMLRRWIVICKASTQPNMWVECEHETKTYNRCYL